MKLYINVKTIKEVQNKIPELMNNITVEYMKKTTMLYEDANLCKRFLISFNFKPSLRFFHSGEFLATGEEVKRLELLRELYHSAWAIKTTTPNFRNSTSDTIIQMDSYESKHFISLAEYLKIDYSNYEILESENFQITTV